MVPNVQLKKGFLGYLHPSTSESFISLLFGGYEVTVPEYKNSSSSTVSHTLGASELQLVFVVLRTVCRALASKLIVFLRTHLPPSPFFCSEQVVSGVPNSDKDMDNFLLLYLLHS